MFQTVKTIEILWGHEFRILMPAYPGVGVHLAPPIENKMRDANNLTTARAIIEKYVTDLETALGNTGQLYYMVHLGKGKTELSVKASLECWAGATPDWNGAPENRDTVTSTFFAPASMVVRTDKPSAGYLPAFFVKKSLAEVAARARHKYQKYVRVPKQRACWPAFMKEAFKQAHIEQLPSEEQLAAEMEARTLRRQEVRRTEDEKRKPATSSSRIT